MMSSLSESESQGCVGACGGAVSSVGVRSVSSPEPETPFTGTLVSTDVTVVLHNGLA